MRPICTVVDKNYFHFLQPNFFPIWAVERPLQKKDKGMDNPCGWAAPGPPSVSWPICKSWAISLDRGLSLSVHTCRTESTSNQGVRMTYVMSKDPDPRPHPRPFKICISCQWWLEAEYLLFTSLAAPSLGYSISSIQLLSRVQFFATPRTVAHQASLSTTNSQSLLKLMSIESVTPTNHLILCRPLLLPPSIFPSIRVFSNDQFFESGGQSIGVSALASVLPMNIQYWFPLGWTGWISLQSKGLSRVFSNTTVQKHQFFSTQLLGKLYSWTL